MLKKRKEKKGRRCNSRFTVGAPKHLSVDNYEKEISFNWREIVLNKEIRIKIANLPESKNENKSYIITCRQFNSMAAQILKPRFTNSHAKMGWNEDQSLKATHVDIPKLLKEKRLIVKGVLCVECERRRKKVSDEAAGQTCRYSCVIVSLRKERTIWQ